MSPYGSSMRLFRLREWQRCLSALAVLMLGLAVAGCQAASHGNVSEASGVSETRLVKHAMGESRVPVVPQRVVALDTDELDDALALGVTPIGTVLAIAGQPIQDYLQDRAGDIVIVGTIA